MHNRSSFRRRPTGRKGKRSTEERSGAEGVLRAVDQAIMLAVRTSVLGEL